MDDAEKLQYFLLEEFEDHGETVMFAPGEGFYSDPALGRNKARIAYVTAPDDLTRAALFLCSEEASFITGQVLGVDGGFAL